jgi:hypothetical protein
VQKRAGKFPPANEKAVCLCEGSPDFGKFVHKGRGHREYCPAIDDPDVWAAYQRFGPKAVSKNTRPDGGRPGVRG